MQIENLSAIVMALTFIAYSLLGGADFGGGVWDLLAFGRHKEASRQLIAHAIGPIWEANHVWLIAFIVFFFTCFPTAFAAISIALHVPLALAALGIVLRGASFTFRSFPDDPMQNHWGLIFSVASAVTPIFFGVVIGTTISGNLVWLDSKIYASGYFLPWLSIFPWIMGCFILSLFTYLAAVYLCVEAEGELKDYFRIRAVLTLLAVLILGSAVLLKAPAHFSQKLSEPQSIVTFFGAIALSVCALITLLKRKFVLARTLSASMAITALGMLAYLQAPYLIAPQFTILSSAAPPSTHRMVLSIGAAGALLLIPSLFYLLLTFKGRKAFSLFDYS